MVLKSANYTNRFRISWKDIVKYQMYDKTDIRNHYVMRSVKRFHGDIYEYLELCKQTTRRRVRILTVISNKSGHLLVTVIEAGGGGGGGGGGTCQY